MKRSLQGVTLVEIMLVLAIMAGILFFGLQQYFSYRNQVEIENLKNNINIIFQAASLYFNANCKQDPLNSDSKTIVPVKLDLLANQRLLGTQIPSNLLVDYSGSTNPNDAYIIQFNQVRDANNQLPTRNIDVGDPPVSKAIGKIVLWKIQVAVPVLENAEVIQKLLNATCVSSLNADGTVFPCSQNMTGNYVVWDGLPSFFFKRETSTNWMVMPLLKQFEQMYSTNPMLVLTDGTLSNQQYFICNR